MLIKKNSLNSLFFLVCMTFIFAFPKAGTKISGIPVYISIFITLIFLFYSSFRSLFLVKNLLIFYALVLILIISAQIVYFGNFDIGPYYLSYLIPMFSPFLLYLFNERRAVDYIKYFPLSFWIVSLYGLSQKIFGDYSVVVPGLTANFYDASQEGFLALKNNMIWGFNYLKLTSTYQNGNLFGVNYLLITWVYVAYRRYVGLPNTGVIFLSFVVSVLTASASVMIGFVFALMLYSIKYTSIKNLKRGVLLLTPVPIFSIGLFFYNEIFFTHVFEIIKVRYFDRDYTEAGGRTLQIFEYFDYLSRNFEVILFGSLYDVDRGGSIYEMWLLSILQNFGILVVLIFFLLYFIFLSKLRFFAFRIPFYAYFIASLSDGAFWLPPTAFNLYILLSLCIFYLKGTVRALN